MTPIHVETRGSGPKVILVHGGEEAGGLTAFAQQIPLAKSFTLIMPDLPGHGKTPANGPTSQDGDAALVAELLTEPMHLVGHSYGGSVAMRAAILRPEMVRSLIVMEPSTIDIAADDPEVRQMLMELAQAIQLTDLRERVINFSAVLGIHKDWPDPLPENYLLMSQNLPTMLKPNANAMTTVELTQKIAAANIPSLVISGGHRVSWEHICDRMATALHAQRAVVTGFGHSPQQNAADFNATVEKFWNTIP